MTDGLRIGVVIVGLRTDGGAERLVHTLLGELRDTAHEVTVFSLRPVRPDARAMAEANGADVVELSGGFLWSPGRLVRLVRAMRAARLDVVHTHLTSANILGLLIGAMLRIPRVVTLHNVRTKADDHWYHGRLESLLIRRLATRVIAVGQSTADARRERLGTTPIHVLDNAVPPAPDLDPERRRTLRAEVMTDPEAALVLTVGRLAPQKAHHDLIDAIDRLRRDRVVELAIAGRGTLEAELSEAIRTRGLEHHVRLLGSRTDARELMAVADVFVLSSHWEGLPIVMLEAMTSGTPIVATTVGDIPAVLDEHTGWLVEPKAPAALAATIAEALDDPEDGRMRAKAAAQVIDTGYGAASWTERTLDHYRAAIDSRGHARGARR